MIHSDPTFFSSLSFAKPNPRIGMDSSLCNCNFNCSSSQFLYFRSPHRIPSRYLIPLPIFISSSFTSIAAIYITNFSFRKLNCRFLCRVKASTLQQKDKKVSVKESLSTKKGLNKDGLTDSGPITQPGFVEKNAIKVEQSINTFLTVRSTYMFLLLFYSVLFIFLYYNDINTYQYQTCNSVLDII